MSDADKEHMIAHCNTCLRETNHIIVASDRNSLPELPEPYPANYNEISEMLKCCGCGDVIFRKRSWSDYEVYVDAQDNWVYPYTVEYYPPAISRSIPTWHQRLNTELRSLIREIYAALHLPSTRLAAMGTRTALDIVLLDKVGDSGTFAQKLDALVKDGHATQAERDLIEIALEAGSAAIHRGHVPKYDDVATILDIVENVLHRIYILPMNAEHLRSSIPPRPKHT